MGLQSNTRHLLTGGTRSSIIEYHFRSFRELYDKKILTADRHHSSAGEWVMIVSPEDKFYSVLRRQSRVAVS
jgi:hypothetical protein